MLRVSSASQWLDVQIVMSYINPGQKNDENMISGMTFN